MKKILTVLILFFSLFLVGCNSSVTQSKNTVTNDSSALVSNYDTDNTNDITVDNSEENTFDEKEIK